MSLFKITNIKALIEMLLKIFFDLQKHIKQGEAEAKKFLERLFAQYFPNSIPEFARQVEEQMLPFSESQNRLIEQLTFVESMIQKLSQQQFKLTDEEEEFLSRLFLASKLGSPESMKVEFDEYLKKLKLMSEIVDLLLYRYIRIVQSSSLYMVRIHLFETGCAETFYEKSTFSSITWDLKRDKDEEFSKIAKECTELEMRYCAEKFNAFKQQFSDFKFNELLSNLQKCVSIFSEQFPISIIDFVFSQEKSDVFKSLLESLLTLETTFLDEKKKFQQFSVQIQTFLNEINTKLERIFDSQRAYETHDFGDCHHTWKGYEFKEPLSNVNSLIMKLTAVWKNACKAHTPVVMTPAEIAHVDDFVKRVPELLK